MGKDNKVLSVENSMFLSAGRMGLWGSALTSIGASIRNNNAKDESVTMLVGGTLVGAVIGYLRYCLVPEIEKSSSLCLKLTAGVLECSLGVAGLLTAPLVGENALNLHTQWGGTVIDNLTGNAVVVGGTLAVASVIGCAICCISGKPSFFSNNSETPATAKPATAEQEQLAPAIV